MKIAYLSAFYPFRGGIAQFNAALYRALEKEHEVKPFTFSRQYPDFLFPGETQYVTANDIADKIPSERILDTLNPFSFFSAAQKIRKFAPHLLLFKYWMSYFAPSLGTVAKKLKKETKVLTILDNVIPHEKKFFDVCFTKYFLRQNHGFVAMSESVKNDLLKLLPQAKCILHPHPLYSHFGEKVAPEEARKKLNIPAEKKVLLFFGFIRDYKGLNLLIDAMGKLSAQYFLVIAGESYGSFEKYERQIKNVTKNNILYCIRYIPDDEVPLFFSAADVCILPYKSATQSGITSIAYHFDLPLIATDTGGLKEAVLNGKTGIIVAYPDAALIAGAAEKYFNQNLKVKFQEEIRRMKNRLSWDNMAREIILFANSL